MGLALSLAVGPVSAQPAQFPQPSFSLCTFLVAIESQLPDVPEIQSAFAQLLAHFGCTDGATT
jgi:hypothetical protein